jgi:hypothetical protein
MDMKRYIFAFLLASMLPMGTIHAQQSPPTGSELTAAQVESARSSADHEAIARSLVDEAAALERKAKSHEAMERLYRGGGAPKANSATMAAHCKRMIADYRSAAAGARALADEHRAVAKLLRQ